jgi:hypothetical protein
MDVAGESVAIICQERRGDVFVAVDIKTFNFGILPLEIRTRIALYGLARFLQDRTSQISKDQGGIKAKLTGMQAYYDDLVNGIYSAGRKAGAGAGAKADRVAIFAALFAEEKGVSVAVVMAKWAALDKATRERLLGAYAMRIDQAIAEAEGEDLFDL